MQTTPEALSSQQDQWYHHIQPGESGDDTERVRGRGWAGLGGAKRY